MESLFVLLALAVPVALVLGVVAFFKALGLARRVRALEARLAEAGAPAAAVVAAAPDAAASGPPAVAEPAMAPPPAVAAAAEETPPPLAVDAPPTADAARPQPAETMEGRFAARAVVWGGGAMLALGVVFLLRHMVEAGWLGPAVRTLLGLALGLGLLGLGEAALRRELARGGDAPARTLLPPLPAVLSGVGLFAVFASVWAAHAVHGLIGPAPAFAALAGVALGATALSLRQGWLIGLIGVMGGFLAPALVAATEPDPATLFGYLALVSVAALGACVRRGWPWLGGLTLLGAYGWPALYVLGTAEAPLAVPLYLLAVSLAFAAAARPAPGGAGQGGLRATLGRLASGAADPGMAGWALGGVGLAVVGAGLFAPPLGAGAVWAYALAGMALSHGVRLAPGLRLVRPAACWWAVASVLLLVGLWPETPPWGFAPLDPTRDPPTPSPDAALRWAALSTWTAAMGALALFLPGAAAALAAPDRRAAARLAAAGTTGAAGVFVLAWGLIGGFETALGWAAAAAGFAVVAAALALRLARRDRADGAAAALAAGASGALLLAAAALLRDATLTLAAALQLAATAAVWRRTGHAPLRAQAGALLVAAWALALWSIPSGGPFAGPLAGFGWIATGWVAPALALLLAARLFAAGPDGAPAADRLPAWLRVSALALLGAAGIAAIRVVCAGQVTAATLGALEVGLQTLWLGGFAVVLLRHDDPLARALGRGVGALGLLSLTLGNLGHANPALGAAPQGLGAVPVANLAGLLYLAPALLLAAFDRLVPPGAAGAAMAQARWPLVAGLLFVWAGFEAVRLATGGPVDPGVLAQNAPLWALSVAWVAYGCAALGLGLARGWPAARAVGLAALALAALKAVAVDMAGLEGLWRVMSFIGLGAALLAIGEAYRRLLSSGR